jgi:aconitase B
MTKPRADEISLFMNWGFKILGMVASGCFLGVLWFTVQFMQRMETNIQNIHEKVSSGSGDHRELKSRVDRAEKDIEKIQQHLTETHKKTF